MAYGRCFVVVVLALVMAPALCQSGVLQHACDCLPEASECRHEVSCAQDPCAEFVNGPRRVGTESPSATIAWLPSLGAHGFAPRGSGLLNHPPIPFDLLPRRIDTTSVVILV